MRLVKMLSLAGSAALAAMAFVGTGPASADTLCKVNEDPCPKESSYPIGTTIAGGTNAGLFLVNGEVKLECKLEIEGKTTENLGPHKGVRGVIEKVTVSNCTGLCSTVTAINLPYEGFLEASEKHVTATVSGKADPGVLASGCTAFKVACLYEAEVEAYLFSYKEGEPAHITASSIPIVRSGHSAFCPAKGTWDALYVATSPKGPLFGASLP